jgi:CO/xanthine dehydrogenase FAD-binding subunit
VRYQRVANEQALLDGLAEPHAVILCGGTDVMIRMRAGALQPDVLLDVSRVETMRGIRLTGQHLEIGAATTESALLRSPLVRKHAPLLQTVLRQLGSVQIRNRGTLGGNLVNASPAADSAVPLLLYEAEVQIVGPREERRIPVEQFLTGPGQTALGPGEFVRTLRLSPAPEGAVWFYHKVGKRNALTIAIASLGLVAVLDGKRVQEIRIAVGSVAPTPIRLRDVEDWLAGQLPDREIIAEARRRVSNAVSPISDVRATAAYRADVVGKLAARALRSFLA